MSLVFSALVPHPPLLIPSIGREHAKLLDETWKAYTQLAKSLAASGAETIVIITPHLPYIPETFLINFSPSYRTHFLEFGDFSPARVFAPDHELTERIRHAGRLGHSPVKLVSEEHLDYGSGVPLYFLPAPNAKTKLVVVGSGKAGPKEQFALGKVLKDAILKSSKKIALIVSGDLSHRHSSDSPAGFSQSAKTFDEKIVANLSTGSASPILRMDPALVEDAHACGYRSVCMFLGAMDKMDYRPKVLSYESPFGVGYATIQFNLK